MKNITLLFLLIGTALQAQNCDLMSYDRMESLRQHLEFLASDELAGRKPGTEGALAARNYIGRKFENAGLQKIFSEGYFQVFPVPDKVQVDKKKTLLIIDGKNLMLNEAFYPTKHSANAAAEGKTIYVEFGIESEELDRDDIDDKKLPGKIAVMEIGSPDGIHPHSEFIAFHDISERVENLQKKGATGVILVDSKEQTRDPEKEYKSLSAATIPVIFVSEADWAKTLRKATEVRFEVLQNEKSLKAYNVGGLLNNNAKQTVVIGAHYDHLGMGGESSLFRDEEPQIHNGADDNASGTSALLELAGFLSSTEDNNFSKYNYLFLAFSGEEMGLLGSNYFVKNVPEDTRFHYMLNMDMIGRMEEGKLQVNGTGTSPIWDEIFQGIECSIDLKFSESGVGPSDHTSFYYQDVPVLHFFTGTHSDYHKPTDDVDKINLKGMIQTMNLMLKIISVSPLEMEFTETKNESMSAPRFSVTLGVMPDYMFDGKGMRIDGVTEGRPADKAGLKTGDVVTKMGKATVSDMMSYMKALGQYKEGDKTEVEYMRDGKLKSTTVQF